MTIEFYLKKYAGIDIPVSSPTKRLKKYRNCKLVSVCLEDRIINNQKLLNQLIKLFGFSYIQTVGLYTINIFLSEEKENSINEFYEKNYNQA
jgi:hypothetical protein